MASKKIDERMKTNYFRYHQLVIDVARPTLQKLLEVKVLTYASSVDDFLKLAKTKQLLDKITPKVIKPHQSNLIYPPDADKADINTWDVTLLSIILLQTCGLTPQENQEVVRLRDIRNATFGHVSQTRMSIGDYANRRTALVNAIQDVLGRIAEPSFETETNDHITAIEHDDSYYLDVQEFLIEKYKNDASDVSLSPILNTHSVHIDEIYTELVIRDDLVHKSKGKMKYRRYQEMETCKTLGTYKQVLYGDHTICNNIYVIGKAGIGKTTWCRKLLTTWVNSIENRENEENPAENERILRETDIIFFISLRHARADRHIMQMIKHQLFPYRPDLLMKAKTLLNNPDIASRCLIVLDGLDEWNLPDDELASDGIPRRDPIWKCPTVTTTRAWKLEEIQLKATKIDRAVEIHGLSEEGTNTLIDQVVSGLNKSTGENKMTSDFKSQVNRFVKSCMQVPLLLTMFVCLWFEGVQINKHLAGTYCELMEMLIRSAEGNKRLSKETLVGMKRVWATEKPSIPDCVLAKQLFVTYLPFLLRLGKLAFDRLFSTLMNTSLVFDYQTIETILSEEELELSVKIGILSQTTHRVSVLKQEFRLFFLHKTLQEYLAALYMVSGDSKSECLNTFKTHCSDLHRIQEMENVILFICGLCPGTAEKISCHIDGISRLDEGLCPLLWRCWRESQAVSNTKCHVYIQRHVFTKSNRTENDNKDTLCYLRQAADWKNSINIFDISENDVAFDQANIAGTNILDLSGCHSVQSMYYRNCSVPVLVPSSLHQVTIHGYKGSTKWVLDLSGCQSLKTIDYRNSSIQILVPGSLEEVMVDEYTGSTDWVFDLSGCQSLRELYYTNSSVRIKVPNSLEKVKIYGYTGSKDWMLDMSECRTLRTLDYKNSSVQILVPDSLENVTIYNYTGSESWILDLSICLLLRTLHYVNSSIQILVPHSLEDVNVCMYTGSIEWVLNLSACQSLRKLNYENSTIQILVPDNLEEVMVDEYTGSSEWTLDLSGCRSLRELYYANSSVRILVPDSLKVAIIYEYTGSTDWVFDLSRCQSLRELYYTNSSVRIKVPNSLEKVKIYGYTGSKDWMLDMSECRTLRTLDYKNSSVQILVPDSLENVTIYNYTGSESWILDLSKCQSLKKLSYKKCCVQVLQPNNLEEVDG